MGGRTVLVGRDSELSELASAIESAVTGSPTAVLVHGEAGVGKTRLVTEAMARGELHGVRALWGRCLRFGTAESSFQPVGQLLTQWFRQAGEVERTKVLHDLPTAKLATVAPIIAEPTEGDEGRLIPLLATVLERICEQAPTVLVIDDLQWADTTSLDLLAYLVAGFGPGQHVGLFATYRDTELPEGHRLRGWLADVCRLPGVGEVQVGPLGLQETEELVAYLCGDEDAVSRGGAVFERSRGNPYFTELLALAPGQDLTADGGIRDALLASWHRLEAPAREVAQLLAVGGRPVDLSVLEQLVVVHQGSRDLFHSCVQELVSGGIGSVNAAGEVWFHHPLLSEVLLTTLSPGELRDIHGEYARMWADADDAPPAARAAHLALHHDGAHHHNEAFEWSLGAAEAAAGLFAWSEEFEHLHRACRLWSRVDPGSRGGITERAALLTRASDSAVRAGEYHVAQQLREEALHVVNPEVQPLLAVRHHFQIEVLRGLLGADSFAVVPEMLTLTEHAPTSPERAIALALVARSEFWSGQFVPAVRHAEEAVQVAQRCGSDEALGWAFGVCSQWHYQSDEGLEDAERAVLHARASGHRVLLAYTAVFRANWLQGVGHKALAAERTLEVYRELVATGSFYEAVQLLPGVCERLVEVGRWPEVRDLLREGLSRRLAGGSGGGLRSVAADLAARTGDLASARQHLARARELLPKAPRVGNSLLSAETRVAMALGEQVRALTLMAEAMPALRDIDDEATEELLVWGARAAADLAAKPGEQSSALAWLDELEQLRGGTEPPFQARTQHDLVHPAWGAICAAESARCRDGGARRPELWADAMAACAAAGLPWEQAMCAYRLAQSLLTTKGSRAQAASALRDAGRIARQLGAAPIVADVESLAAQSHIALTEPAPAEAGAGTSPVFASLTRRELEVLNQLVAGRTYAEIAQALFISEKTVSVHVSSLLRKTGTASRIELADLARRLGLE